MTQIVSTDILADLKKNGHIKKPPKPEVKIEVEAEEPKAGEDPLDLMLTETGNAKEFARRNVGQVFHVVGRGWVIFDGKRFVEDLNDAEVTRRMSDVAYDWYRKGAEAGKDGRTNDAEKMLRFAKISLSSKSLAASLKEAAKQSGITAKVDEFDADPMLLNAQNGVVNLRTGEIMPHSSTFKMTRITSVGFNPQADAPTWKKFMADVFLQRQDMIDFMRRWLGYGITGITKEQKYVVAWGEGGNGKSTLFGLVMKMLGSYAEPMNSATITARREKTEVSTGLSDLPGLRFVVCTEWHDTARPDETVLKDLTGGDRIKTRTLYQKEFSFTPTCKLNIFGNDKPDIKGTDHATWRRILFVPFEATFDGAVEDKNMPAKLEAEGEGILADLVRGCVEWQQQGLQPPTDVAEATARYREEQDEMARFIKEFCDVSEQGRVGTETLWTAYKNKFGGSIQTVNKFGRMLKKKGYESKPNSQAGIRMYHGLTLKPQFSAFPPPVG